MKPIELQRLISAPHHSALALFCSAVVAFCCMALSSCNWTKSSTGPEGNWSGTGEFRTSMGSMVVKAQLEIMEDGSYRYLILDPGILALTGAEHGTWTMTGENLVLTQNAAPASTDTASTSKGNVFQKLRQGAGIPAKPKILSVDKKFQNLVFDDGRLLLNFTRSKSSAS